MAKSKISKVKETLMDSVSTTQETVGQVVGKARQTIESVGPRLPKRGSARASTPKAPAPEPLERQAAPRKVHGDALLDGSEPAAASKPAKKAAAKKAPAKKTAAKKAPAKKATAKKATAKKATAKKTTAKKTTTKKAAAKRAPAKKTPAKKTAAKKTAAKKTPAKKTP